MDDLLPALRMPVPKDGRDGDVDTINPADLFDGPKKAYWMEIGFGGGEHLAATAMANPDIGFIGCEPFVNGVASLLSMIEENNLKNIRIFDEDVRYLLPALHRQSLERLFLLYPDPWHKKKHNTRRLVSDENLAHFARLIKPGGEFRFASDISDYVRWTLDHMSRPAAQANFSWLAERPADWRTRPDDMIQTRYETKARQKGSACTYLRFMRQSA
jgi:tRNA (guanine-N7-)-methyltransferase